MRWKPAGSTWMRKRATHLLEPGTMQRDALLDAGRLGCLMKQPARWRVVIGLPGVFLLGNSQRSFLRFSRIVTRRTHPPPLPQHVERLGRSMTLRSLLPFDC